MENINLYPALKIEVSKADTPDFRARIESGLPLPENPYTLHVLRTPGKGIKSKIEYWNDGELSQTAFYTVEQNADSYPRLSESQRRNYEQAIIGRATNSALTKMKGQSLPLIQMYLERKETASSLAKLVSESIFVARNIRRPSKIFRHFKARTNTRKYRTVRAQLKKVLLREGSQVGDAWLCYRMFLTPLYHDVVASLNAAADYEKKNHTFSVRSSIKVNETSRISYDSRNALGVLTAERPGSMTLTGGVTVTIKYVINDTTLTALSSLTDYKAALWDLTPWSFIVDRFVDISSYLELSNATIGTKFTSGVVSSLFEWNGSTDGPWIASYYPDQFRYKLNGRREIWTGMPGNPLYDLMVRRTILKSYPTPVLEFPFRQGWKQITDEIVLLRKLLSRRT